MGGEKTRTDNTQAATMSEEEKALLAQQQQNNAFMMPYAQKNYASLSDNIYAILQGNQPMAKGINGVSDEDTNNMANAAVQGVLPQFQSAGILDSGLAFQGATRAAADIRNQNAQFNVSAAQNLFNLAAGGQSSLQSQYQGSNNALTSQLAGLRTINQSGSTIGMNPFLRAFQTEFGTGLAKTTNAGISSGLGAMCWVAAEVFDGWSDIRTIQARFYIMFHSPKWFRNGYAKFGKNVAEFISNKPALKITLKPLFELFSKKGKEKLNGHTC